MAGIDGNSITSADWPLASDELAFVTELVGYERIGSEQRAKEVLFGGVEKRLIRWCYATLTVVEKRDFQANPPVETPLAAANLFFWRRDEHSRIDVTWYVDRQTSCVVREGPVVRLGSDGMGNSFPIFDSRAPSSWTANLVRFHHGDVVNYLVTLGLMPPPAAPTNTVAVVEDQNTVAGTSIVEQPDIGSGDGILRFGHSDGARDLVEWSEVSGVPVSTTTANATSSVTVSEPPVTASGGSAKRFVGEHPPLPEEGTKAYFDRLEDLCRHEYPRKTLRNRYYEIRKNERNARVGQHGPASGPK